MENNISQPVTLISVLNAIKRNILTIAYFVLTALLLGFIYTKLQPTVYSSTAQLVYKSAINDQTNEIITSQLKSDDYLTKLVDELAEGDITHINGEIINAKILSSSLTGGVTAKNAIYYNITFETGDKEVINPIIETVRDTFINYLSEHPTHNAIGSGLSYIGAASEIINIGIGLKTVLVFAVLIGGVISLFVILVKDVLTGYIFDKHDIFSFNVVQIELDKNYRKITRSNFMSFPVVPTDLVKALKKGHNKGSMIKLQNQIIASIGFDNNVQAMFSTVNSDVHALFVECYIKTFQDNDKTILLINLDENNNFQSETVSLVKAMEKNFLTGETLYLDINDEFYPSSIINSSAFLDFVKNAQTKYDYILINGGSMSETYIRPLSKLATPFAIVYSGLTKKKTYNTLLKAAATSLDSVFFTVVVK